MAKMVGAVGQLRFYPVKSMAGIAVEHAHVGLDGIVGDRQYAFVRAAQASGNSFPWMTARESTRMILYRPQCEAQPTPEQEEPAVQVQTPGGALRAVDDPLLLEELSAAARQPLYLLKSGRGIFDCQHLSLFSLASVRALAEESGAGIDARQFRANLYFEPASGRPFDEEEWAGQLLRIGGQVRLAVTRRDRRCMMINLDPHTASQDPRVLRTVAQRHDGQAGVYANVVRPGQIRVGDTIEAIDAG